MQLDLSWDEKRILADAVSTMISDLRMEISGARPPELQERLRGRMRTLTKVLSALSDVEPSDAGTREPLGHIG